MSKDQVCKCTALQRDIKTLKAQGRRLWHEIGNIVMRQLTGDKRCGTSPKKAESRSKHSPTKEICVAKQCNSEAKHVSS